MQVYIYFGIDLLLYYFLLLKVVTTVFVISDKVVRMWTLFHVGQLHKKLPVYVLAGPHVHGESTVATGIGFPQCVVGDSSSHAGKTEGASVCGAESTSAEHRDGSR